MIESVSSFKLAKEISRVSAARGIVTKCLAEVNIGQEESKSGIMPQELVETLYQISELPAIEIKGLWLSRLYVKIRMRHAVILPL